MASFTDQKTYSQVALPATGEVDAPRRRRRDPEVQRLLDIAAEFPARPSFYDRFRVGRTYDWQAMEDAGVDVS